MDSRYITEDTGEYKGSEISRNSSVDVCCQILDADLDCLHESGIKPNMNGLRRLQHAIGPRASSILPGFLRTETYNKKRTLTPTSWLLALRGFAGCLVAMDHMGGPPDSWTIMEWPIIRCLRHGRAMPDLFFVASSFVLAYQMLKFMRTHDANALLKRLTSLSFRRYLRLYLPVGLATFITMLFMVFNLIPNPPCPPKSTVTAQVGDWFIDWLDSSNPFHEMKGFWHPTVFRTHYIDQMWTIPLEFRGSMMIFATCTALSSLTSKARITTCSTAVLLCYYWQEVWSAMFFGGMVLAESSLNRQDRQQQSHLSAINSSSKSIHGPIIAPADAKLRRSDDDYYTPPQPPRTKAFYTCILLLALVFLGQPNNLGADGPFPYTYTHALIPSWWTVQTEVSNGTLASFGHENFWFGIGSLLFIYAVDNCPMLQTPFRSNFGLYLGEISFGVYAMNNLVAWTLDQKVLRPWRGVSDWFFVPEVVVYFVVVLWVGDYFRRVDNQLVRFQFWLQKRYFVRW